MIQQQWQIYLNYYQRMEISSPKKRVNRNKCVFRDKPAYVWGHRYRWDPLLSRNLIPRFPHFKPPCLTIKDILANDTEVQHFRMNIRRRSSLALSPNCWSPTKSCNRHHHRTHVNQCHHFFQIYFISSSLHTILLIFLVTTDTLSILPVP